jgi:hypothetical protein
MGFKMTFISTARIRMTHGSCDIGVLANSQQLQRLTRASGEKEGLSASCQTARTDLE